MCSHVCVCEYVYIYIYIIGRKKSRDHHLAIIDLFQLVTSYEKPTYSDNYIYIYIYIYIYHHPISRTFTKVSTIICSIQYPINELVIFTY